MSDLFKCPRVEISMTPWTRNQGSFYTEITIRNLLPSGDVVRGGATISDREWDMNKEPHQRAHLLTTMLEVTFLSLFDTARANIGPPIRRQK